MPIFEDYGACNANNGDPDQVLPSVPSDLSLHCLHNTLLGASG